MLFKNRYVHHVDPDGKKITLCMDLAFLVGYSGRLKNVSPKLFRFRLVFKDLGGLMAFIAWRSHGFHSWPSLKDLIKKGFFS